MRKICGVGSQDDRGAAAFGLLRSFAAFESSVTYASPSESDQLSQDRFNTPEKTSIIHPSSSPMTPRHLIILLTLALLLPSCISPEGYKKSVWHKQELLDWYNEHEPTNSNLRKFGYAGSDEAYHHFITRPIDSFLQVKIPRNEITIPDERPRSSLTSRQLYFYLVDPRQNFRKVPSP